MTTVWPVSPWRRAFREDCFLPSAVLGPVECCELARLISDRLGVVILAPSVLVYQWVCGVRAGGSGRWLKGGELEGAREGQMRGGRHDSRRRRRNRLRHNLRGGQVGNLPHLENKSNWT